jgi:Fur family transcriptional regulator, ferric uptake regulator
MARMRRSDDSTNDPLRERIRAAGLRCTPARLAVFEHLEHAAGPRTHAEVAESLASLGYDQATIYRNLVELTDAKLISRVELGDHMWRFEAVRQGHHGPATAGHPHFVCTECGEVSCLDDVNVAITPRATKGRAKGSTPRRPASRRTVTEVLLKGRCGDCG